MSLVNPQFDGKLCIVENYFKTPVRIGFQKKRNEGSELIRYPQFTFTGWLKINTTKSLEKIKLITLSNQIKQKSNDTTLLVKEVVSFNIWSKNNKLNLEFQIPINVDPSIDLIEVLSEKLTSLPNDNNNWLFFGITCDYENQKGEIFVKEFSGGGNDMYSKFVVLKNRDIALTESFDLTVMRDNPNESIGGFLFDFKILRFNVPNLRYLQYFSITHSR